MTPVPRRRRRLRLATLVVLAGAVLTTLTAAPLFVGFGSKPLIIVHVTAALTFFAALGVKLMLLGARAGLRRGRRLWRLLIAQAGSLLAAYTLLTGLLVLLDPAWADQHLAAGFWLGVILAVHARQYADRLRAAPDDAGVRRALGALDAPALALLDLTVRKGLPDARLAAMLDIDATTIRRRRQRALARIAGNCSEPETQLRQLPPEAWTLPAARSRPKRIVIVGGGMAGQALAEQLASGSGWAITLLAEENVEPYDRTRLSEVLHNPAVSERLAARPAAWYRAAGIDLRMNAAATTIDVAARHVVDGAGDLHAYDALVLATGSRPFVPPIPGAGLGHVLAYRTRRDAEAIAAAARVARTAVVVGGGLLGLEAAASLTRRGTAVTVVEAADRLMPQQLDAQASELLRRRLARLGVEVFVSDSVARIAGDSIELGSGRALAADLVVVAAGIRPETRLAVAAGLRVDRAVVVDDQMRSSAPGVWAVGECAEHRGVIHGLWPPVRDQVRAAAAALCGRPAPPCPPVAATALKVAGVDLFVAGRATARPGDEEIVRSDGRSGSYTKLVLEDDRLAGAILLGDAGRAGEVARLLSSRQPVPADVLDTPPVDPPPSPVVCHCKQVSAAQIRRTLDDGRALDVEDVSAATGAGTGCGSCASAVSRLVAEHRDGAARAGL